jgi:hypothetical protein
MNLLLADRLFCLGTHRPASGHQTIEKQLLVPTVQQRIDAALSHCDAGIGIPYIIEVESVAVGVQRVSTWEHSVTYA